MSGRVLVTGASGFVGRQAIPYLAQQGFEIHAAGRQPVTDARLIFHAIDLLDPSAVTRLAKDLKASHLLHLAWNAEPGRFWHAPDNLDWVAASLMLLRNFADSGGTRAVFTGTCAEYAWGEDERLDERGSRLAPSTLYGTAKDALRRVAEAYADTTSLSIAWGRLFFLYGPGEKRGRLVSDAIWSLCSGHSFPTSEGHQRRDFMHIEDAAHALVKLLASDVCGPVNIASGQAVSVHSILEAIGKEIGRPDLIQYGERQPMPGDPAVIEAAVARLSEEVGFLPRYTQSEGLAQTVRWWREQIAPRG